MSGQSDQPELGPRQLENLPVIEPIEIHPGGHYRGKLPIHNAFTGVQIETQCAVIEAFLGANKDFLNQQVEEYYGIIPEEYAIQLSREKFLDSTLEKLVSMNLAGLDKHCLEQLPITTHTMQKVLRVLDLSPTTFQMVGLKEIGVLQTIVGKSGKSTSDREPRLLLPFAGIATCHWTGNALRISASARDRWVVGISLGISQHWNGKLFVSPHIISDIQREFDEDLSQQVASVRHHIRQSGSIADQILKQAIHCPWSGGAWGQGKHS